MSSNNPKIIDKFIKEDVSNISPNNKNADVDLSKAFLIIEKIGQLIIYYFALIISLAIIEFLFFNSFYNKYNLFGKFIPPGYILYFGLFIYYSCRIYRYIKRIK